MAYDIIVTSKVEREKITRKPQARKTIDRSDDIAAKDDHNHDHDDDDDDDDTYVL